MGNIKVVVVAWWGWGWGSNGWGGWAGWYVYASSYDISDGSYTVTVGLWWAKWGSPTNGADWQNSVFSTITAKGWWWWWAYWPSSWQWVGRDWWSGWGWWRYFTTWLAWWTATQGNSWWGTGYGFNWGTAITGSSGQAGWGWAWAVGVNADGTGNGQNWGIGRINDIVWSTAGELSWGNYYLAWWGWGSSYWGAGWGNWWLWGWWAGKTTYENATSGTANTGWGWWWIQSGYLAGDWGSGVVIISYATDGSDGILPTSTGWTVTTSWTQTIHTFTTTWTFTVTGLPPVNTLKRVIYRDTNFGKIDNVGFAIPAFYATWWVISYSGSYTIHKFLTSGTFTIFSWTRDLEVLVVAWGWGWGNRNYPNAVWGWGGWAGWLVYQAVRSSVTIWNYTVTIWNWGVWWTTWAGGSWQDSVFDTITAKWWGWGGAYASTGNAGGSWWGWGRDATMAWWAATQGSSWWGTGYWNAWGGSQWYAGTGSSWWGWGAWAVWWSLSNGNGSPWGDGKQYSITGAATYYAWGWWGSGANYVPNNWWLWGWWAAADNNWIWIAWTANTGWGWGWWWWYNNAAWTGGSWVVIISYLT